MEPFLSISKESIYYYDHTNDDSYQHRRVDYWAADTLGEEMFTRVGIDPLVVKNHPRY